MQQKLKKRLKFAGNILLAFGASITLGFLSFGGMYAFGPLLMSLAVPAAFIVPVAIATGGLAVVYEAEIYYKNIKGTIKKIFRPDTAGQHIANTLLKDHFPDIQHPDCPEFFKEYEKYLRLSVKGDKGARRELKALDRCFYEVLFAKDNAASRTKFRQGLRDWLNNRPGIRTEAETLSYKRTWYYRGAALLSSIAAVFMGLGMPFLLAETLESLPFVVGLFALPGGFIPAIILGGIAIVLSSVAYGLLIYNSITDMINNDTLVKWYQDLRNLKGITWGNALRIGGSVILVLLAVALTACTAGTWWTIAKELPFFIEKVLSADVIGKLHMASRVVMGVINPIVMFFSALSFNLPNIKETYDMFNAKKEEEPEQKSWWERTKEKENYWQIFNPFRLALFLTVTPLKLIFFFGHLISIGLIDDRVPGIPQIVTASLGILSEFFEDAHYFLGGEHKHPKKDASLDALLDFRFGAEASHNHEDDIPSKIIKCIFLPLYCLAAGWDSWASTGNKKVAKREFTFDKAFDKFWGVHHHHHSKNAPAGGPQEVSQWEIDKEVTAIETKKEKLNKAFFDKPLARIKVQHLTQLQIDLDDSKNNAGLRGVLENDAQNNQVAYNTNRFRLFSRTTTDTEKMRAQIYNTLHRESPPVEVQQEEHVI